MTNAVVGYFDQLSRQSGEAWNRFWFEPSHPATVCALRIVAGLATLIYLLSATPSLLTLFAADGILPVNTVVGTFVEFEQTRQVPNYRYSAFYYLGDPTMLWIFHAVSIAVAAAFTVGVFSRITNLLTLLVMLSWVHRAPMLTGQFEPVLTMLLLYLCIAPTGACYSLTNRSSRADESWLATISVRLIQVHVSMFYLMFALTKLSGQFWWGGGAAYLMMAQSESRLIDLTALRSSTYAINLLTHAIVGFELLYSVLIWNRLLRPLVMAGSVLLWITVGSMTGLVSFAAIMILLNLAFIPGQRLAQCCGGETT